MTTREALIERLAMIVRAGHFAGQSHLSWDVIPESTREEYREEAREMWPLIVAFVGEWIEANQGELLAEEWREAMEMVTDA